MRKVSNKKVFRSQFVLAAFAVLALSMAPAQVFGAYEASQCFQKLSQKADGAIRRGLASAIAGVDASLARLSSGYYRIDVFG